ncbi:MAG TPA: hypothetical protein VGC60_19675 [Pyrinomonadaceae bacterium]
MRKTVVTVGGAVLLLCCLAVVAASQVQTTTVTKVQTVQNPDGTYTIVEYPVGKETVVTLNPVSITGATGRATILRDDSGTTIKLNLDKLPADLASLNLYAVDSTGAVIMLGPVEVANGVGTFMTTTPLTRFMLVASPEASLTAYDPSTKIFFRSAVPAGLTVIPIGSPGAVGEQVADVAVPTTTATVAVPTTTTTATVAVPTTTTTATVALPTETGTVAVSTTAVSTTAATVMADYAVPMLGIPHFKKEESTKLKIDFSGTMEGARANIFIEPKKHGKSTEIMMHFHDLREAPKGLAFVLWAVSADHQFQKLGQIVNVAGRNEAKIESETDFDDFGLLLTTEPLVGPTVNVLAPSGKRVGVIQITP